MASDLLCAVEYADGVRRGDEGERARDHLRRDRIVIEIEPDINSLAGTQRDDPLGFKRMGGERDQSRALLEVSFGDRE